jgi:hypothetical protein
MKRVRRSSYVRVDPRLLKPPPPKPPPAPTVSKLSEVKGDE